MSSILARKNPSLLTDMLRHLCDKNGFSFICNEVNDCERLAYNQSF